MPFHDILIPLSGGPADDGLLAAGLAMAGFYPGAVITGSFAQPPATDAMIWSPEGTFGGYSSEVISALEKGAGEARKLCEDRVASYAGVRLEHLTGQPDVILTERAALADLVVMDCPSARNLGPLAGVFERILLVGRAPVLVLRRPVETLTSRAVVAWDASPPAARSLRAAMPMLAAMDEVLVVQAPDAIARSRVPFASMDAVLARLTHAGIKARSASFAGGSNVSAAVQALARDFGADLLVAGAYGHSRLGEFVLGGTSRDLLADKASPSLFLHH